VSAQARGAGVGERVEMLWEDVTADVPAVRADDLST
jgi:hypothetical protein